MREILPPLFQIFTGLGFFLLLLVGTAARPAIKGVSGKLIAFSLLAMTMASFVFSRATAATSIGAGAELFMTGGGLVLLAGALVTAGLFMQARSGARD